MSMPRWQRAYVIACAAIIGGAFAYAMCEWAQWPRLTYLPNSGEIALHVPPGAIAVTYLGIVAWGAGGALVGAVIGALACAAFKRTLGARVLQLLGAWAITAILLAGFYYTWTLWPW